MTFTDNCSEAGTTRKPKTDLRKVVAYMEHHFHEPLSIGQLAELAGISPKYFVELFRKTYGRSAIEYVTDLRISRAKRYLAESEHRLRDIAQLVGYSDEFYFSRKFKKEVGVSPSAFSKNARQQIAACSPSVMGQLLALDIIPVAVPLDSKWTPYYFHAYQGQIKVPMGYKDDLRNVEWTRLIQARPDAIVGNEHVPTEVQQKLNDTAPTLFFSVKQAGWSEQLLQIAQFLGRVEHYDAWMQSYRHKVRMARERMVRAVGKDSFVVLRVYGSRLFVYSNRGIGELLYQELGLVAADPQKKICNSELTLKQLGELDPKRIMVLVCPELASRAYWLSLQHNENWRMLEAVRQGHVYPIPSDPWCEYSASAVNRMLDELLLLFTGDCPNPRVEKSHGRQHALPL